MRIERQDEVERLLQETLAAARAAQKAAESANGYLFWMNVGYFAKLAVTAAIVIGLIGFGIYVVREVRSATARIPAELQRIVNAPK